MTIMTFVLGVFLLFDLLLVMLLQKVSYLKFPECTLGQNTNNLFVCVAFSLPEYKIGFGVWNVLIFLWGILLLNIASFYCQLCS